MTNQNKYENLFDEFMDIIEFSLVKYSDGMWSVIDNQGADLGNIQDDRFENAGEIFDRMDIYIEDYFVKSLEECLREAGFEVPEWSTYNELADYARPLLPDSERDCDIIDMICNHSEEVNLDCCLYYASDERSLQAECPHGGDTSDDCADCVYGEEYCIVDGECVRRKDVFK